jgi:hypothetical protein
MTQPVATISEALDDPSLLGRDFAGASWNGWRAILKAAYALPMSAEEVEFFRSVADRDPPTQQVRELVVIAGRRAGKDSIASAIAAHAAAFRDYRPLLRRGETAVVACLANDRDQARIVHGYTTAFFADGLLNSLVERWTVDGVELSTGAAIEIMTNSSRATRGRPYAVVIFDECAFWRDDASANPDKETYRAITPGLATIPGAMLVMISSPYRKSGLLFEKYRRHYGQNGDVLVIKAPSRTLNPTLDQRIVDEAMEDDPIAAAAEWLAEFRSDISSFVEREVIEGAVVEGRREIPPALGPRYFGFVDPSGGSSDSMTLAVAHRDGDHRAVLDALREVRPPFSPEAVVVEFAMLLESYGIGRVVGDRYAGEWPRERFRLYGIDYVPSDMSKSEIYQATLPILNSGRAELLDDKRLVAQFCGLERRTARGGRESIDHAPGAHDDVANSCAGALVLAAGRVRKTPAERNEELRAQSPIDVRLTPDGAIIGPPRGSLVTRTPFMVRDEWTVTR